jgi:DNA-binding NarL/FixJ family response regulator
MTVRVVLADDQPVVREGLRAMLGLMGDIEVVGVATTAEEALAHVAETDPDVLLTDLRMPGMGGVEGIRRLRASNSRTQAVALTTYDDDTTIVDALSAGALGFLNKDADPETIATAIHAAASGRALLDAKATTAMLRVARADTESAPAAPTTPPDGLTDREVEVLRLVAAGLAHNQIARELYVSVSTVKTHINHLFAKTGCSGRAGLVRYAYTHRLTS